MVATKTLLKIKRVNGYKVTLYALSNSTAGLYQYRVSYGRVGKRASGSYNYVVYASALNRFNAYVRLVRGFD